MVRRWMGKRGGRSAEELSIGLDVGTRRTKVVGVAGPHDAPEVRLIVDRPTAPGLFAGHAIDADAAAKAVSQMVGPVGAEAGVKVSPVLPVSVVKTKRVMLPVLDDVATMNALAMDPSLRVAGVDGAAQRVAFHRLSTPHAGLGNTQPVLAATVRLDAVRAYERMILDAGYTVGRVGAFAIALANVHEWLYPADMEPGKRVAIVHGGYARVDVVVIVDGAPVVSHGVLSGIEKILERARVATGQTFGALERLMGDDETVIGDEMYREWVLRVEQEVRRGIGAASRDAGGVLDPASLSAIRVSGGLARYPALLRRLGERLGHTLEVLDPAAAFSLPTTEDTPAFGPALVPALGLALETHAARGVSS